jgi:threonyl-tRNA synthetase
MNCPFHILIYQSRTRSYRELPLRLFEFGTVYRYEKSGVVHGLTRVRGMTQDDAHIFCTKEQMAGELASLLDFVLDLLRDYGLDDFYLELFHQAAREVGRERRRVGRGDRGLAERGAGKGLELVMDEGGGAFYGPKISVQAERCDRPHLADVDDPARLPDATALRHHYVGARQRAPTGRS